MAELSPDESLVGESCSHLTTNGIGEGGGGGHIIPDNKMSCGSGKFLFLPTNKAVKEVEEGLK